MLSLAFWIIYPVYLVIRVFLVEHSVIQSLAHPSEGSGHPLLRVDEVAAWIPFKHSFYTLGGDQLVLLTYGIIHMGHEGVLGAELPVSEAEVHGIAVHLLPIDIDCPLRIPDRGRSGGDTVADVGVIACPQREQSGQ